jgi:LEA14-like dessication related protein
MAAARPTRWIVQSSAALLLAGCASVEPPSVTSSLQVQPSTVFEQRFLTTFRIQNPNTFDLDVEGLSFDLEVNDQPFAKGVGRSDTVVPAFGTGVVQAEAVTTLMGFVRQVQAIARAEGPKLSYRLTGKLKLRDRTFSVPFEMRGDDLLQLRRPSNRRDE